MHQQRGKGTPSGRAQGGRAQPAGGGLNRGLEANGIATVVSEKVAQSPQVVCSYRTLSHHNYIHLETFRPSMGQINDSVAGWLGFEGRGIFRFPSWSPEFTTLANVPCSKLCASARAILIYSPPMAKSMGGLGYRFVILYICRYHII